MQYLFNLIVYICFITHYIKCSLDDDEDNVFYMVPIILDNQYSNFLTIEMNIDGKTYNTPIDINSEENWVRTSFQSPSITDPNDLPLIPTICSSSGDSNPISGRLARLYGMTEITINHITAKDDCQYESSLSLGIQYPNKEYALIESMRDYVKKVFGLYFEQRNHHDGKLMIGNLINEVIDSRRKSIFCDTFVIYKKWNCYGQGIYIGDIQPQHKSADGSINFIDYSDEAYYRLSTPVIIESMHRFIIVPTAFFNYLRVHYFAYLIETTYECSTGVNGNYLLMTCDKRIIDRLPVIHFIFNKNMITFRNEDLFEEVNDDSSSMRFKILGKKDSNDWSLGIILLQKYNLVFDYPYHKLYMINQAENVDFIKIVEEAKADDILKHWNLLSTLFGLMISSALIGIVIMLLTLYMKKPILEQLPVIR